MNDKTTDQMIDGLCQGLQPVVKQAHPALFALALAAGVAVYVAAFSLIIGLRSDVSLIVTDGFFWLEIGVALVMGVSALLAASWLRYPDQRQQPVVQNVPLVLLGIFMFWILMRFHGAGYEWHVEQNWWRSCFAEAFLVGCVPTIAVVLCLRDSSSVAPVRMMLMAVLGVAAIGWAGLRFTCGMDTPAQAFGVLYLPFILAGGVAAMAARRVFRW